MRRKLYIFCAFFVAVLSGCIEALPPVNHNDVSLGYPEGEKVAIDMSVEIPGEGMASKAMADTPTISSMRVVVFGSSGFLKESVEVEDLQSATTNGNSTLYTFKVHLSASDSKNLRINVIANCDNVLPWQNEDVVINQNAYSTGNNDAYWCRFILPNGITLKTAYNEQTQAMEYVKNGDYFCVTDDVTAAFSNLPLLRNFAKITVESTTPQLVLDPTTTMAVVNQPDRGSVAPYKASDGSFINNYYTLSYAEVKASYDGFAPDNMRLLYSDPADVPFVACGKSGNTITGGQYIFERPKPGSGDSPSYLIIHGKYYPLKEGVNKSDLPSNWKTIEAATPGTYLSTTYTDCYYKVDFSDSDGYYAILRNFRYHIRISNVSKAGASSPAEAGSTGTTGDISSSTETQGLNDISDGYGRLVVSYMGMTLVQQKAVVELKYKFIYNADRGDNAVNNRLVSEEDTQGNPGLVTITIGDKEGGSPDYVISSTLDSGIDDGNTIDGGAKGKIRVLSTIEDDEKYRTIQFTTNAPSSEGLSTQKIRISGTVPGHGTIYRDIQYDLMAKQSMTVTCVADVPNIDYDPNYVEAVAGEGVNVNIAIPKLLPESVFPLLFNIESDKLSITPNTRDYPTENLPVESGYSICTGKSNTKSFHYVRTLSYSQYNSLPVDQNNLKTFTCHFKTNMSASASTVYVSDEKGYFNTGSARFENYTLYRFSDLSFSNYSAPANTNVNFYFSLDAEDATRPRTVKVVLDELVPQNSSATGWNVIDSDEGIYSYTISSGNTGTLNLKTITAGAGYSNYYSVELSALDNYGRHIYRDAEHSSESFIGTFTNLGFYSKNNNNTYTAKNTLDLGIVPIYFRFDYQSGGTGLPVTFTLTGLTTDDSRLVDNGNGTFTFTPDDNNQSQYVKLKPTTRFSTAQSSVQISSSKYNPVDPVTINRATSFTIPAGALYARNSAGTGNPSMTVYDNYNGTDVYMYANTNYNQSLATFYFNSSYLNRGTGTVNANSLTLADETVVYFRYNTGNYYYPNYYFSSMTLDDIFDVIEGTSSYVTLRFRTRTSGTFTINMGNANYTQNSHTSFSNSDITVSFQNSSGERSGNTYYKVMGSGSNNGSMTVSCAGSSLEDCQITQVTMTYRGNNYRAGDVTCSSGSYSRGWNSNTGTWTGGTQSVSMTMGKDGNNFNQISQIVVTYSYYSD